MSGSEYLYTHLLAALCGFLLLIAAIQHYAPRTALPAESWLLLAGIGYGLLASQTATLPSLQLNPELVVSTLLPVLVFAAGRSLSVPLLLRSVGPVTVLVLAGIPSGMLLIGLPTAWLLGIPPLHGVLFGAAVAATDPASVGRILRRFRIPEQLKLILHGESIFNDAVTIVAFSALSGAIIGRADLSLSAVAIATARSMLLAVPVGLLLGWLAGLMVRRWHEQNRVPGLTLTLVLPFGGYLLSERLLHASGIIAVLCAALAFSHTRKDPNLPHYGSTREADLGRRELYDDLWEYLGSVVSSALYFALGAAIAAQAFPLDWTLPSVVLLLLFSRAVLVYGSGPLLRAQGCSLPRDWRHVIMLGGLRGAVPAALVLLTPPDYVYRDQLLAMVFVLVAYTVVVHPLLLRGLLQRHAVSDLTHAATVTEARSLAALPLPLARRLEKTSWGLAAIAGLIAGAVFLILEVVMVPLFQGMSPWVPIRMIAAIALGPSALPPPTTATTNVVLAACVVHFTLSLIYGWILASGIEGLRPTKGVLVGVLFGLALYLVNFYAFTAVFPWFAEARTWIAVVVHLVFGASLAGRYLYLVTRSPHRSG